MKVVTVREVVAEDLTNVTMKTLFDESLFDGARTKFGKVIIPPGARVPDEGMGAHDEDEYSFILQGTIKSVSGGKEYRVSAGEATFIPKGEEHYAYNDGNEDCIIIYSLVKR